MKIFLLESDAIVKNQISQHIQKNYQAKLSIFDDSAQLIKASVSNYPDMIIFGLNENSKNLFAKLASFRNSFNTKLIVIVSFHEKEEHYPLEIAHHILYKPFTVQDLEHCFVNYLGANENLSTEEIQQDEIRQLDILESNNFNFDVKKNFELSNKITLEDVKNELYDDISILDTKMEKTDINPVKKTFNPEVFFQGKNNKKSLNSYEKIFKNYFQKIEQKNKENFINKNAANTRSMQVTSEKEKVNNLNLPNQTTSKEKKEEKISSLSLSHRMNTKENIEGGILSISDFNLKFLD